MTTTLNQNPNQVTAAQQKLISELIAGVHCQFKPDGKHECGRKHGQMEGGNAISLFEVRDGIVVKGVVCNKCKRHVPSKRSFVPIRIIATESVLHMVDEPESTPDPDKDGGNKGNGGGQKKQPLRRDHRRNHRPNKPATQSKPATEAKPETATPAKTVVAGGRWLMLVTEYGLSQTVFDAALDKAANNHGLSFIDALKQTPEGSDAITRWQSGTKAPTPITTAPEAQQPTA
jgi:hypothetical protein